MVHVHYGSKSEPGFDLEPKQDLIAIRTHSKRSLTRSAVPLSHNQEIDDGTLIAAYPEAGVEVYRIPLGPGVRTLAERKQALRTAKDVRFAGGVLADPETGEPVLYTENLFIQFADTCVADDCEKLLRTHNLSIKKRVSYAANAYFVAAPEGTGQQVFALANQLLQRDDVLFCHPELIRPAGRRTIFPQQWHLKQTQIGNVLVNAHAHVEAAHELTRGDGVTIAIIDDGVDIAHPEFSGSGKIVWPRDVTLKTNDPRPKDSFGTGADGDNHGTAVAGVACANGQVGACGVAPQAKLMPIRLASSLGSMAEEAAFEWAVSHGADVISCSWGPPDGKWYSANDPAHKRKVALPASTRLAIDHALTNGRGGKGCVVLFAAGNGNESVDHDGYASYPGVIAVAACNDRGKRSVYSDFGKAIWCAFPSSDMGYAPLDAAEPLTPGIWTTDRSGAKGYNTGSAQEGDAAGAYTNSFGGTSSACPGAAGVAALVLAINPELKTREVRELLKQCCDPIDPQGGAYDQQGHSPKYGYGRLNARRAVELAKPQPRNSITVSRRYDAPLPDLKAVTFELAVAETAAVKSLTVGLDLEHTYIGDLLITLIPPPDLGEPAILHNRSGASLHDIKKTYDATQVPALAGYVGRSCAGTWRLRIEDKAKRDTGTLHSLTLNLQFA